MATIKSKSQAASPLVTGTPLTSDDVIYQIRVSAQVDAERVQAVVDAAVLGAEQVQDKRIDLLEKGPEVSASEFLLGALVVFVLETQIGGSIARKAAQTIFRPVLRRAGIAAAEVLRIRQGRREYVELLRFAQQFGPARRQVLAAKSPVDREMLRKYHSYLRAVSRSDDTVADALVGIGKAAAAATAPNAPTAAVGDSPGVAVLKAAQSYSSGHRAAIAATAAGLELAAKNARDQKALEQIAAAAQVEPLDADLSALRDRYALCNEAAIWALLFGLVEGRQIRATRIEGVERRVVDYWEQRFAGLITEWLQGIEGRRGPDAMRLGDGLEPLRGEFLEQAVGARRSHVHRFLMQAASDLRGMPEGAWRSTVPVPNR